ncbi:MAG: YggT family protein [Clostridia bacterium]|nr:YggT family protein [Clostridia bacterium]
MQLLTLLCRVCALMITATELCLLVYAILSWVSPPSGRDGAVKRFITAVGETVTMPMRALLERFDWARQCPIDISFLATVILLSIFRSILSGL